MIGIENVEAAESPRFPNIANGRSRSQFVAVAQAPVAGWTRSSTCHDVESNPVLLNQIFVFQIVVGSLTVQDCIQLLRVTDGGVLQFGKCSPIEQRGVRDEAGLPRWGRGP